MGDGEKNRFSGAVSVFHERRLPEPATPAGYAALIDCYGLNVPLPRRLAACGGRHRRVESDDWLILTPRHAPSPTLETHLTFALKYEGLELAVLKRLFEATGPGAIEALVAAKPTGSYARRIWFLYEHLTAQTLDLPNAKTGKYANVVNADRQYAVKGRTVARQRVRDNLPGTASFCPLVYRTQTLDRFIDLNLAARGRAVVADVSRSVLARAAAFLLLKDSRSSYAIEGEQVPQDRIQRWGRAIGEAGRNTLDMNELLRLQLTVLGGTRFVDPGLRSGGGFVGEHDRVTHMPLPEHISARPEDLSSLGGGMIDFDRGPARELDSVIAAAILAFGFVYAHPFEDGNGRVHRYLIHHVLAQRGFNPPGVVFPVSSAILDRIDEYKAVLANYSDRLLPLIKWAPTSDGNVRVLNDTADFYRFFDATPHAEFLFACVEQTIERDLPEETEFLRRYDQFRSGLETIVEMPDRTIDLLFRFLHQNEGKLSRRARTQEFEALTDDEVKRVQHLYKTVFSGVGGE